MSGPHTSQGPGRRRLSAAGAAVLVLVVAGSIKLLTQRAAEPPSAPESTPLRAAAHSEPRVAAESAAAAEAAPSAMVMPVRGGTPPGFQEAVSAAHEEIFRREPGLSPPLMTAVAIREAMARAGCDPDRTLLYWLSPEFERDLAAYPPGERVDARRTADSLVAQALGDGLGDAEFEQVLARHSASVRDAARARRAAR